MGKRLGSRDCGVGEIRGPKPTPRATPRLPMLPPEPNTDETKYAELWFSAKQVIDVLRKSKS